MKSLSILLLFAFIGVGCAQSFWSEIAQFVDDIVDGEDFSKDFRRNAPNPIDDDDDLVWGSNDINGMNDVYRDFFNNRRGFGDDFPRQPQLFPRLSQGAPVFPRELLEEFDEEELKPFFPEPRPQLRRSPSEPRRPRNSGPRGQPQRPQLPRRNSFPRQDGPKNPTPTLQLNKTDCICRLRTTSRIVNGEEATPNRYANRAIHQQISLSNAFLKILFIASHGRCLSPRTAATSVVLRSSTRTTS